MYTNAARVFSYSPAFRGVHSKTRSIGSSRDTTSVCAGIRSSVQCQVGRNSNRSFIVRNAAWT